MLVESKPIDNIAHVRREFVDVAVEIRRELVRVVEQLLEIEPRKIVERAFRDLLQQTANDRFRLFLDRRIFFQHCRLRRREQAVKLAQNRQRQNDFAIFVPLVRPAQKIADAPDKIRELRMRLCRH